MDGLIAAANEGHTGAMVALIPTKDEADRLALDEGEDVDELHCTLLYLGEAADLDDPAREAIRAVVAGVAQEYEPIIGDGFAICLFNPASEDRDPCVVLGLSGADLAGLQHELVDQIEPAAAQHQPWIPHITLAYDPDPDIVGDLIDHTGPVEFDRLRVAFGDDVTDYELGTGAATVAARPPYPGQKWRHGWIPTTYALAARWHSSLDGLTPLIDAVESGEVDRFEVRGGKMAAVRLVDHNNGTTTIEKRMLDVANTMGPGHEPERQADAEQLAGRLGQKIGAPVPLVLRTHPDKVTMNLVEGDRWSDIEAEVVNGSRMDQATAEAIQDRLIASPDGIRLGVFDLLIGNWDRPNATNWLVEDGTNRPVGIDHAFSWSEMSANPPGDGPPAWALSPFAEAFVAAPPRKERKWKANGNPALPWKDNPLTAADIEFLKARLAELEHEFEDAGRHDWWQYAVARLEAIARHAAGTESVFT